MAEAARTDAPKPLTDAEQRAVNAALLKAAAEEVANDPLVGVEGGRYLLSDKKTFVNADGKLINENNETVNSDGKRVDSDGKLLTV